MTDEEKEKANKLVNEANQFYNNREYEKAIKCYDQIIEINPNIDFIHSNKGFILYKLGLYNDAIDCCDKALKINIKYANAYINKGIVLSVLEKK